MRYLMVLAVVCIAVFPAYGAVYGGGSGTAEDPYQISSAADWTMLTENSGDWDKHFILTADIDFGGAEIGSVAPDLTPESRGFDGTKFSGTLDGKGHTLRRATLNFADYYCVGLFGYLAEQSEIRNLSVRGITVTGNPCQAAILAGINKGTIESCYASGTVSGTKDIAGMAAVNLGRISLSHAACTVAGTGEATHVGGLVATNDGTITDCHTSGNVTGPSIWTGGLAAYNLGNGAIITQSYSLATVSGKDEAGGLVGRNDGTITYCFSSGAVSGEDKTGGLVGSNQYGAIRFCHSSGDVTSSGNDYPIVGGLVGINFESAVISDSYATGNVHALGAAMYNYRGGFAGRAGGTITHCYATGPVSGTGIGGGGFAGESYMASVTNCYWDVNTSGLQFSALGEKRTTVEMTYPHSENTYVDWDFTSVWQADDTAVINNGYPYLRECVLPADELPAEGEAGEGQIPEGAPIEGAFVEGQIDEGETPEGEPTEGLTPEGEMQEGETPEGLPVEGDLPEGQAQEGASPEGQSVEGQKPAEGESDAEGQKPVSVSIGCSGA